MAGRLRIPKLRGYAQSRTATTLSDATFGLLYATSGLPHQPGKQSQTTHTPVPSRAVTVRPVVRLCQIDGGAGGEVRGGRAGL